MQFERDVYASAVMDNKFFVISSYVTSSQRDFCRDGKVYNPELNTWTQAPNMWSLSSKPVSPTASSPQFGSSLPSTMTN